MTLDLKRRMSNFIGNKLNLVNNDCSVRGGVDFNIYKKNIYNLYWRGIGGVLEGYWRGIGGVLEGY